MCIGATSSAASSTNTNTPQRDDRVSAPHAFYERLARSFRLILFDKRGTGRSGRALPVATELRPLSTLHTAAIP
jgi:pimeloyl-ACP methyl ester carboxylesterase